MKIIVVDNIVTIETPSNCTFNITIKTDAIDIEGIKPPRDLKECLEGPDILNFRTLDPNKVRLTVL